MPRKFPACLWTGTIRAVPQAVPSPRKCVLVVDDDPDVREATVEALRDAGYDVREAVNGKHALAVLEAMKTRPCLVLLDMMMPEMSGGEMLRVLSESQHLASLPVVIVSGEAKHAHGARRLLRKPLSVDLLLKVVEEFCGRP